MARWNVRRPNMARNHPLVIEAETAKLEGDVWVFRSPAEEVVAMVHPEPGLIVALANAEAEEAHTGYQQ